MNELKSLLKRSFDMFCQRNWLKTIDKELNKYNKLKNKAVRYGQKADASLEVTKKLIQRYNEIYSKEGVSDATQQPYSE